MKSMPNLKRTSLLMHLWNISTFTSEAVQYLHCKNREIQLQRREGTRSHFSWPWTTMSTLKEVCILMTVSVSNQKPSRLSQKGILRAETTGDYKVSPPLVNITVAGLRKAPKSVEFHSKEGNQGGSSPKIEYSNGTAYVTGLERFIQNEAFSYDFQVIFKY
ncbi:hypothetical protein LB505_011115 [Fusarium chuoi]|nr:hypothetical protein LB505_011115 [Fusarium chuoi]